MMRFAANLSTLCQDIPRLTDRLTHLVGRKDYSFKYVECQNPYGEDVSIWKDLTHQHNLEWILINSPPLFDCFKKDPVTQRTPIPSRDQYRDACLSKAISFATQVNCKKIHLVMTDVDPEKGAEQSNIVKKEKVAIHDLLNFAARQCEPHGITCVIEPLSIRDNYYLKSYEDAVDIVSNGGSNLKIMLDTFHLQRLHGNLTEYISNKIPKEHIGHVQISQTPLRDCPMNEGEVDHKYVLSKINEVYDGVIGLEYNNKSHESFSWLKDF